MQRIAVILLNYNSSSDCRKSIGFLRAQRGVETDIILVDNASGSDDRRSLRELAAEFNLPLILSDKNAGYNAGNNLGLRMASERGHDIALIANPDMEFHDPDYLAGVLAEWQRFPDTVIAGTDIIVNGNIHTNPLDPSLHWSSSLEWIGNVARSLFHIPDPRTRMTYRETTEVDIVEGSAMFLKLDFIRSIGYLDERNFLYCEEWILERQARKNGKKALFIPSLQALHCHRSERRSFQRLRLRHQLHSRLFWLKNYSGYPRAGQWLAALSFRLYYLLMSTYKTVKNYH